MCAFWRFYAEAVEGVIFGRFSNVDNFRPEVHSDVISRVAVDPTGLKARVKFGDYRSNHSRDIGLPHFERTTTTTTTMPADGRMTIEQNA